MNFFQRASYGFVRLWALVLMLCPAPLLAQFEKLNDSWRWVQFTTEIGLPTNRVFGIAETPSGKIWAETQSGFAWFDGYYWHAVGKENGISELRPFSIVPDTAGHVFVLMEGSLFHGGEKGFRRIPLTFQNRTMGVSCVVRLSDHRILFVSDSSLYVIKNDSALSFATMPELSRQKVIGVWATADGSLWINSLKGLFRRVGRDWMMVLPASRRSLRVTEVVAGKDGRAIAYIQAPPERKGIWEFDPGCEPRRAFADPSEYIQSMDVGPNGDALLCIETGGFRIRHGSVWNSLLRPPEQMRNVLFVKFTDNGDLWVGSESGLHLHRGSLRRWSYWVHDEGSARNSINAILRARDSSLWLAMGLGVEVHKKDNSVTVVERIGNVTLNAVTGLAQDSTGHVWISSGSAFEGAYRWDGVAWKHFGVKEGLGAGYVHNISIDRKGRPWFLAITGHDSGSGDERTGLGAFEYSGGAFTRWGTEEGLLSGRVYTFVEGPQNEYWFGTDLGLSRWRSGQWTHWTQAQGLKGSRVFAITIDKENRLWFCDQHSGVAVLENDVPRYFTTADGLISNAVWDLKTNDDGRLWIATRGGLSSYSNGTWASFGPSSGLSYARLWPVLPEGDKIYVGTVGGGAALLDLEDAGKHNPVVVPVLPVVDNGSVLLRWNAFTYFGSLGYRDIETRFRIDDGEWSPWKKNREVTLTNLAPGGHKVVFCAKSEYGTFDSLGQSVSFSIPYPFYQHPAFFLPLGALSFGLVGVTIVYATRKRKYDEELRRSEARYRSVVEDQSEFVVRYLPDGRLTFANKAHCLHYGIHPDDLIGTNLFTSVSAEDRTRIERKLSTLTPGNPVATDEHCTITSHWYQWTDRAIFDESGRVIEFQGVGRDITELKRVEQIQELSARSYSGLFNSVSDAIYIHDKNGMFLNVNQGAVDMYGYSREELIGHTPEMLSAPGKNDLSKIPPVFELAFQGFPQSFEWWGKRKNGEVFPKEVILNKGTYFGQDVIIATARDITERKQAEEVVRESETALQKAQQVAHAGSWAWYIQEDRLKWSDEMFRIFGIEREGFTGNLTDVIARGIHPDDRPAVERANLAVINNRTPNPLEYRVIRPDGRERVVWAEAGELIVDDGGRPVLLTGIAQDITDRKRAEEALRASEEQLRHITENMSDVVCEGDERGVFRYISPSFHALVGYRESDLIGKPLFDLIHPEDRSRVKRQYLTGALPRRGGELEFRYRHLDGHYIHVSVTGSVLVDDHGKSRGVVLCCRDITERKQSQELYRRIVEGTQAILFNTTPKGIITFANEAACRILELPFGQIVGRHYLRWVHPDDRERAVRMYSDQIHNRIQSVAIELKYMSAGRRQGWLSFLSNPVLRGDEVVEMSGVAQDITERKRVEIALQKSTEQMRAMFETTSDGISFTDLQGKIVDVNEAVVRMHGYSSKEELLGRNAFDLIAEGHRTRAVDNMQMTAETGRSGVIEYKLLTNQGEEFDADLNSVLLRDNQGRPAGFVALTRDITERKRVEAILHETNQMLEAFISASPLATVIVDPAGLIRLWNPAAETIFGWKAGEVLGEPNPLIFPREIEEDQLLRKRITDNGESILGLEVIRRRKGGSPIQVNLSAAPLHGSDGRTAGVMSILEDITGRKQAEERIKTSLREKEVLLKEIHHRVKNNLQVISSLLNLQCSYIQDERSQAMFRESQNRVKSMALIHEKLYQSEDLANIDFALYVRNLTGFLFRSYVIDPKVIAMAVSISDVHLNIEKAIPCGLIINELVSNSLKHAFPNGHSGRVFVGLSVNDDSTLTMVVGDNGVGVSTPADLRTADSLGLRLVASLADQLGATIEVNGTPGTEYRITFPM